jgi:hypothetical protein
MLLVRPVCERWDKAVCGLLACAAVFMAIPTIFSGIPTKEVGPFQTPFGRVLIQQSGAWSEPVRLLEKLKNEPPEKGLLSTYMTGVYLLTGQEPRGLYTYWHRLSTVKTDRDSREELALTILRKNPPEFVLIERERATFAPHFGEEFGEGIYAWIQSEYGVVSTEENAQGGKWVLWKRKHSSL